jgi:DNA-binding HxlR family transcriptional regulator
MRARAVQNLEWTATQAAASLAQREPWPEAGADELEGRVMIDYGQFCTVARGAEAIGERWTLLVVRELLCGSTRFNAIHRGVPRMSASLLAQRLRSLEQAGVIERHGADGGNATRYRLTPAGEELRPIVLALGHWGARWIGGRLQKGQLDAGFLMWDISRFVDVAACPRERCVTIHFRFSDAPEGERRWWLVIDRGAEANLCRDDPGQERTVVIESTVRALTEVWTGDREAADAVGQRAIRLTGMAADRRDLWRWLGRSAFAATRAARPAAGGTGFAGSTH